MITSDLRALVDRTVLHAENWHDRDNHTVAAGLLTKSGQIVLGMNTYHFLGGPCGEVSALSNHAASRPDDPVIAVAAVDGPSGSLISPCGKCRQILFDMDPSIQCVVRGANGFEAVTVGDLLPFAYDWRDAERTQRLYMWEGYEESIRSGSKRQTIRIDDPFRKGPAVLVFEKESGEVVTMDAEIAEITRLQRRELTEEHALHDGFATLFQLHEALDLHYPGLSEDAPVDIVAFSISSPAARD